MKRQAHLITLRDIPYFVFPESVGIYTDCLEHSVFREEGALNNFNIHYVASGRGYAEIDGEVHELHQGQLLLYFPLQQQRYFSSKDDPWDVRWVHFYGDKLHDYMIERGYHKNRIWKLRQHSAWEEAHMALLQEAETNSMNRPAALSSLAYAVLAEFVQQAVPLAQVRSAQAENRIIALLPYLQEQADQPFVLQEWADRAEVSPHYFCKLFRSVLGMTPSDYVTRARLQRAKQKLLEHRDAKIGDIAEQAGYPSVSYFNKRFQEHEGMTPTEYRNLFQS
ncbi:AraC family transcriptional regulator [Paenibacillus pasadenensis]|uniref:helix-turn-helix transcriptional regulator n=1 Tax=Paenibacillus pasadenensis TaxID=217090 RepID=UPI00203C5D64|nr:AraC family transcriptional regulator [Paenibacillus pasadenensis]MCM3748800.1 AraC family transcriptional regulator [Paenibacillus pasadenensis]